MKLITFCFSKLILDRSVMEHQSPPITITIITATGNNNTILTHQYLFINNFKNTATGSKLCTVYIYQHCTSAIVIRPIPKDRCVISWWHIDRFHCGGAGSHSWLIERLIHSFINGELALFLLSENQSDWDTSSLIIRAIEMKQYK